MSHPDAPAAQAIFSQAFDNEHKTSPFPRAGTLFAWSAVRALF
jgi:hypothetical protein